MGCFNSKSSKIQDDDDNVTNVPPQLIAFDDNLSKYRIRFSGVGIHYCKLIVKLDKSSDGAVDEPDSVVPTNTVNNNIPKRPDFAFTIYPNSKYITDTKGIVINPKELLPYTHPIITSMNKKRTDTMSKQSIQMEKEKERNATLKHGKHLISFCKQYYSQSNCSLQECLEKFRGIVGEGDQSLVNALIKRCPNVLARILELMGIDLVSVIYNNSDNFADKKQSTMKSTQSSIDRDINKTMDLSATQARQVDLVESVVTLFSECGEDKVSISSYTEWIHENSSSAESSSNDWLYLPATSESNSFLQLGCSLILGIHQPTKKAIRIIIFGRNDTCIALESIFHLTQPISELLTTQYSSNIKDIGRQLQIIQNENNTHDLHHTIHLMNSVSKKTLSCVYSSGQMGEEIGTFRGASVSAEFHNIEIKQQKLKEGKELDDEEDADEDEEKDSEGKEDAKEEEDIKGAKSTSKSGTETSSSGPGSGTEAKTSPDDH